MLTMALVQARMSSSRLPGKVLKPLLGQPMLIRQLERINQSCTLNGTAVVTSTDASDNLIEQLCQQHAVKLQRGSLDDVLDRYLQAATSFDCDHIVRITADCPLICPEIIDQVVTLHLQQNNDYTCNCLHYSFPDGLDVEVISFELLQHIANTVTETRYREHVTLYVRQHPQLFKVANLSNDQAHGDKQWSVDYACDFDFVETVYRHLYPLNPAFSYADILELLSVYPDLENINHSKLRVSNG